MSASDVISSTITIYLMFFMEDIKMSKVALRILKRIGRSLTKRIKSMVNTK
jgi:hypothetical protein